MTEQDITEGNSTKFSFNIMGGDIVRDDGTCAGYVALDFQAHYAALEAKLDAAYRVLENVYDAWIDSDAHNRCAPGECVQCDKTYAVFAAALQSYKQSGR